MDMVEKRCPKCNEECYREEADIGVGVIHGPWGCPNCRWSEDPNYDQTNPDHEPHTDQYGGKYNPSASNVWGEK
jgi:hypothetical protein